MVRSTKTQELKGMRRLGKPLRITPKANCLVNAPGFSIAYAVETIEVIIGIGKDHTASLIMDTDTHKALLSGEKVHVTTTEEFKKKYEREPSPTPN